MVKCTFIGAAALILLGIGVFLGSGTQSATAMIPAFVGLPIALAGLIALKPSLRMHAMHAAVLVALLGTLAGLGMGLQKSLEWAINGEPSSKPLAIVSMLAMGGICLTMMVVYVQSFVAVRRQRKVSAIPDANGSD